MLGVCSPKSQIHHMACPELVNSPAPPPRRPTLPVCRHARAGHGTNVSDFTPRFGIASGSGFGARGQVQRCRQAGQQPGGQHRGGPSRRGLGKGPQRSHVPGRGALPRGCTHGGEHTPRTSCSAPGAPTGANTAGTCCGATSARPRTPSAQVIVGCVVRGSQLPSVCRWPGRRRWCRPETVSLSARGRGSRCPSVGQAVELHQSPGRGKAAGAHLAGRIGVNGLAWQRDFPPCRHHLDPAHRNRPVTTAHRARENPAGFGERACANRRGAVSSFNG